MTTRTGARTRTRTRRRPAAPAPPATPAAPATDPAPAQAQARPGAVVIAGDDALGEALADRVVLPVLGGFPVEVTRVPAAPAAKEVGPALAAIMSARVVVAAVVGTSPEILLGIARRGRSGGRTILLAPALRGVPPAADVLRHPATARGVREIGEALRTALHGLVCGDRAGAATQAEAVRLDVLGAEDARKSALRRIEAGVVPVADKDDVALEALCRAYGVLGAWTEVARLADIAGADADPSGLPASVVWVYAVALNRVGRDREAQRLLEERLERDGPHVGLLAALGRIHKDRWAAGGRGAARELGLAIRAYRRGFDVDEDYYPGVNALTLMAMAGRSPAQLAALAAKVRAALARGRNPDEHPWWYWATRVQVEVIVGDLDQARQYLDGLLAQPSEEWMRESTGADIARLADLHNRQAPTAPEEIADSDVVRGILAIRQAVLDGVRAGRRGLPPHCVLEVTRRGGDRWVNFTNADPSPLFCRSKADDADPGRSVLFGDPVGDLREDGADQRARKGLMESISAQLAEAFELTSAPLIDEIHRDGDAYLVLQLDEGTAIEPWELLAERGSALSVDTTFARRLWLGPSAGAVRRRTGAPSRRALVIGDPNDNLPGARDEATQVAGQLEASNAFPAGVVPLIGSAQATAARVSEVLAGGGVDLLHYAGHALATEDAGGLQLADDRLRPDTLAAAVTTPVIVVANACSTGQLAVEEGPRRATFVTSLTRAGVDIYLGCAWPVGDVQARTFSQAFYAKLLAGETIGEAVKDGRKAIQTGLMDPWDPYWAAYVLYGNPWYRLVEPLPRAPGFGGEG